MSEAKEQPHGIDPGYEEYQIQRMLRDMLKDIDDARTIHLTEEVFRRLPRHDQLAVWSLSTVVVQDDEVVMDKGLRGVVKLKPYEQIHQISFNLDDLSDATARFIVAHEFAHVVLRHLDIANYAEGIEWENETYTCYTPSEQSALRFWNEEHATLQVYYWGFTTEIKAYFDTRPEEKCPRFIRQLRGAKDFWQGL